MPISDDKTLIQVIISKKTDELIYRYCKMFNLSKSQFCNLALCEKVISLLNKEVPCEKT